MKNQPYRPPIDWTLKLASFVFQASKSSDTQVAHFFLTVSAPREKIEKLRERSDGRPALPRMGNRQKGSLKYTLTRTDQFDGASKLVT